MKTLLAILLCFVITEAPVLAIHGGYTLGGTSSVTGTYAGVFVPDGITLVSGTTADYSGGNSLGLFSLNVPNTGDASGPVMIFSAGRTFAGTITGFPNPSDPNGITGIITATYAFTVYVSSTNVANGVTTTTVSNVPVTATAQGSMTADVSSSAQELQSPTGVLLTGSTSLAVDQGTVEADGSPVITEIDKYLIEGYQQSASYTASAATATTL